MAEHDSVRNPSGGDQHLAWWRERAELIRRADAIPTDPDLGPPHAKEELWSEQWDVERLICRTAPETALASVVVATLTVALAEREFDADPQPELAEDELLGGATLARYILANAPADLRALVERA